VLGGLVGSFRAASPAARGGQDDTGIWLEVDVDEGLQLSPSPEGGTILELSGWSPEEDGLGPLEGLPAARLMSVPGGAAVELPYSLARLTAVRRVSGGWRFVFASTTPDSAFSDGGAYRLGVRDMIEIYVHGHDDLSRSDTVPPDGVLNFPLIGQVQVVGRTTAEVAEEIRSRLEADYLVDPKVTVRVSEYESQWVNVVGFVRTPGKYPIKGPTTLVDMITQAGGITENAGPTVVVTRTRPDGTTESLDVGRDELFTPEGRGAQLVLHHGDVVNVPEQPMFYIQGEVASPGTYPLERGYTLLKAISVAGGMSQWADRKSVELHRDVDGETRKIVVNLKAIEQRREQDVSLLPEDIIIVKRRLL
jgi:polysaccharide export outer membrane protein